MKWNVGDARQNFSRLLNEAKQEPQSIYRRDRFVAAVLDAETYEAFRVWQAARRKSLKDTLSRIQTICEEEDYELVTPDRTNRANPFDE